MTEQQTNLAPDSCYTFNHLGTFEYQCPKQLADIALAEQNLVAKPLNDKHTVVLDAYGNAISFFDYSQHLLLFLEKLNILLLRKKLLEILKTRPLDEDEDEIDDPELYYEDFFADEDNRWDLSYFEECFGAQLNICQTHLSNFGLTYSDVPLIFAEMANVPPIPSSYDDFTDNDAVEDEFHNISFMHAFSSLFTLENLLIRGRESILAFFKKAIIGFFLSMLFPGIFVLFYFLDKAGMYMLLEILVLYTFQAYLPLLLLHIFFVYATVALIGRRRHDSNKSALKPLCYFGVHLVCIIIMIFGPLFIPLLNRVSQSFWLTPSIFLLFISLVLIFVQILDTTDMGDTGANRYGEPPESQ